jgi:hypothetical protein
MNYRNIALIVALCAIGGAVHTLAAQDRNNNRKDEKREDERVRKAQQEVSEIGKKLSASRSDLNSSLKALDQSQTKFLLANRQLREAQEAVEAELGRSIGLPEALEKVRQQRDRYNELIQPVIAQLHATPEWKTLQTQVAQAKIDRQALRENVALEADEHQKQLAMLDAILNRPDELESQAIHAKPACVEAQEELKKAQAEVGQLRKKLTVSKVDSHPKVAAAKKQLNEILSAKMADEKKVTAARNAAVKVQQDLSRAQEELLKAKQADAKDPNRNDKNSNSEKKKRN